MKRRRKSVVALLLIFVFLQLAISTSSQAQQIIQKTNGKQILIVDINGGGDYTSIQEAINHAQEGYTIYVKTGSYCEIIEIKKQISLIGEDKESTLINPISEKNKYAIRLGAPGVMLNGFSITNGASGLYASGVRVTASKTEIKNCNIYNTPVGIVIWTSDNIVDDCNFWGCKDEGIALIGSKYSDCNNNKILNCKFYNNCDGIELQYSSNNYIFNCEIYENTHTGIDAIASSNNNNKIAYCNIYNNEVNGIYFSASSDNQIIECSISNNDDGDIIMSRNSKNNQILTKQSEISSTDNEKISFRDTLNRFFDKISNLRIAKMNHIFASNNF